MAPMIAIDEAWFNGKWSMVAKISVAKIPNWPAAPIRAKIGCDNSGRKSINAPIPISVVGGQYSIGCNAAFTGAAGTIGPNATVCVRMTASTNEDTVGTATLSIGPETRTFSVMTRVGAGFSVAPMVWGGARTGGCTSGAGEARCCAPT